jgi:biopolymer transport protein ExbD
MAFMKYTSSEDAKFQIAPMIDVIFLLLIFYVCAATFDDMTSVPEINLPEAKHARKPQNRPEKIIINITKRGTIILFTDKQREYKTSALSNYLNTQKKIWGPDSESIPVILRIDQFTYHKYLVNAMEACARASFWNLKVSSYARD